jgi:hypothetical protein
MMRASVLSAFALSTMFIALPASAQTYGGGFPVCLHQYGPVSYFECNYTTIAQCNASASGRAAQCDYNPYYANAGMGAPRVIRHRRHHAY